MIITRLMGGLGNQMFQYAAGLRLAKRLGTRVCVDLSWLNSQDKLGVITKRDYELGIFGIKPMNDSLWLKLRLKAQRPILFKDSGMRYNPDFKKLRGNVILEGFWQSVKYFEGAEEDIFAVFRFPETISVQNRRVLKTIEDWASVSVHVRRGDYANDPQTKKFHGLQPLDYFQKASALIKKRVDSPHFFVFSDDPEWCRKNLKLGAKTTFVTGNTGAKSYEDMRLMAACKHNIIVNSSFSWWGAWLNQSPNKIVIAPRKWWHEKTLNSSDVIPEDWVTL